MKILNSLYTEEQRALLLRPIDDLLFNLMYEDTGSCQELIRTILEDDSLTVLNVTTQDSIPNLLGRGVRLDVSCRTADGKAINVEVQRFDNDDHFRRIRYNSSVLTARHTSKGTDFKDVVDVFVIYITEFDIIKTKKAVCHIRSVVEETGEFIDDGLNRIIVNASVNDGTKTARLMNHFKENYFEDPEFPESSKQINYFKKTKEGRRKMGSVMESIIRDYMNDYKEYHDAEILVQHIETIADSIHGTEEAACQILKVPFENYQKAKTLLEEVEAQEMDKAFA